MPEARITRRVFAHWEPVVDEMLFVWDHNPDGIHDQWCVADIGRDHHAIDARQKSCYR